MKKTIINITLVALGLIAFAMIFDDDVTGKKTFQEALNTKIIGFTLAAAVGYVAYIREARKYHKHRS